MSGLDSRSTLLGVSLEAKPSVTLCENCGVNPARSKFCSGACRQAAHRKSPAHSARLQTLKLRRKKRRENHFRDKYSARSLGLNGWTGPVASWVPSLGSMKLPKL